MQNQRIMGEPPRVRIKPETRNAALWAKREKKDKCGEGIKNKAV
jgi:hypothetical protein